MCATSRGKNLRRKKKAKQKLLSIWILDWWNRKGGKVRASGEEEDEKKIMKFYRERNLDGNWLLSSNRTCDICTLRCEKQILSFETRGIRFEVGQRSTDKTGNEEEYREVAD